MDAKTGDTGGCPIHGDGGIRALLGRTNKDWWPEMLATESRRALRLRSRAKKR